MLALYFSAGYETGVGSYKHVYFNATTNTLIIWALTVVSVVAVYEAVRKVFVLLYQGTEMEPRLLALI